MKSQTDVRLRTSRWLVKLNDNFGVNPNPSKTTLITGPPNKKRRLGLSNSISSQPSITSHNPSASHSSLPQDDPQQLQNHVNAIIQDKLNVDQLSTFLEVIKNPAITKYVLDHISPPSSSNPQLPPNPSNPHSNSHPRVNFSLPQKGFPDKSQQQSLEEYKIKVESKIDKLAQTINQRLPIQPSQNPNKMTIDDVQNQDGRGWSQLMVDYQVTEQVLDRVKVTLQKESPDDMTAKLNKILNSSSNQQVVDKLQGLLTLKLPLNMN